MNIILQVFYLTSRLTVPPNSKWFINSTQVDIM